MADGRTICAERLDRLPWMVHRFYTVGEVSVGVRTTSERFGQWLDEAFADVSRSNQVSPVYSAFVGEGLVPSGGRPIHALYRGCTLLARTDDLDRIAVSLVADLESLLFPTRTDAIFVDAAMIEAAGVTALVPAGVGPSLLQLGRRVPRAGIRLPMAFRVAIDTDSGTLVDPPNLVPIRGVAPRGPAGSTTVDSSAAVRRVDLVGIWSSGSDAGLAPSRAAALLSLAAGGLNLHTLGGAALTGIGRLVETARPFGLRPASPSGLLDALSEVFRTVPAGYATGRREVTHSAR